MIRKVVAILSLVFIGYSSYAVHLVRDTLPSGILSDLNFTEICDNGIDDDADGYVDNYDIDCPCSDSLFNATCDGACQAIKIDTSFKMKLKWKSEVIGNSLSNILVNDTNVYIRRTIGGLGVYTNDCSNSIYKLNGNNGKGINEFILNEINFSFGAHHFSIFKWGEDDYLACNNRDTLILIKNFNNFEWKVPRISFDRSTINVSDINEDGVPELIISNKIISISDGTVLIELPVISGRNSFGTGTPPGTIPVNFSGGMVNTLAIDILPSLGKELVAGNIVYELNINVII